MRYLILLASILAVVLSTVEEGKRVHHAYKPALKKVQKRGDDYGHYADPAGQKNFGTLNDAHSNSNYGRTTKGVDLYEPWATNVDHSGKIDEDIKNKFRMKSFRNNKEKPFGERIAENLNNRQYGRNSASQPNLDDDEDTKGAEEIYSKLFGEGTNSRGTGYPDGDKTNVNNYDKNGDDENRSKLFAERTNERTTSKKNADRIIGRTYSTKDAGRNMNGQKMVTSNDGQKMTDEKKTLMRQTMASFKKFKATIFRISGVITGDKDVGRYYKLTVKNFLQDMRDDYTAKVANRFNKYRTNIAGADLKDILEMKKAATFYKRKADWFESEVHEALKKEALRKGTHKPATTPGKGITSPWTPTSTQQASESNKNKDLKQKDKDNSKSVSVKNYEKNTGRTTMKDGNLVSGDKASTANSKPQTKAPGIISRIENLFKQIGKHNKDKDKKIDSNHKIATSTIKTNSGTMAGESMKKKDNWLTKLKKKLGLQKKDGQNKDSGFTSFKKQLGLQKDTGLSSTTATSIKTPEETTEVFDQMSRTQEAYKKLGTLIKTFQERSISIKYRLLKNEKLRENFRVKLAKLSKQMEIPIDYHDFYALKLPEDGWEQLDSVNDDVLKIMTELNKLLMAYKNVMAAHYIGDETAEEMERRLIHEIENNELGGENSEYTTPPDFNTTQAYKTKSPLVEKLISNVLVAKEVVRKNPKLFIGIIVVIAIVIAIGLAVCFCVKRRRDAIKHEEDVEACRSLRSSARSSSFGSSYNLGHRRSTSSIRPDPRSSMSSVHQSAINPTDSVSQALLHLERY